MIYWTPTLSTISEYVPSTEWNPTFSEEDKIKVTNLFHFFKSKKGYGDDFATILSNMIVLKSKQPSLRYSDEQEILIKEALKPIFNT